MSAQHTPGPWYQGRDASHPDWNGDSESAHNIWPDPHGVGRLIARAGLNFTGWIEQDAANARLIAAAPELLEALAWFINDIDGNHTVMVDFDTNVEKARAAIASAQGDEQ